MFKKVVLSLFTIVVLGSLLFNLRANTTTPTVPKDSKMFIVEAPDGSWQWVTETVDSDGRSKLSIIVSMDPQSQNIAVTKDKDVATKTRDFFAEGVGAVMLTMLVGGYKLLSKRIDDKVNITLCDQVHTSLKDTKDNENIVIAKILDGVNEQGILMGRIDERLNSIEKLM